MHMKNWIREGLIFGCFIYVLNILIFPMLFENTELSLKRALIGIPVFLVCGLGYGYFTRILYPKWTKKKTKES